MNVIDAIRTRRSIKSFLPEPVERVQLERLLSAAVLAPNHRLTQPWRFLVLGPVSRAAYVRVLSARKAAKVADAEAAAAVVRKVEEQHATVPAMIAVAVRLDENPEVREEDFAATWMAMENLCLEAVEEGLGTHVKTGAVMEDPRLREALAVPPEERVVAIVQVGRPAEQPSPKARRAADENTRWLP